MIHHDTMSSSQVYAMDLASKGCCVNPIPNTGLADLFGFTIPPLQALPSTQTDLDAFYDLASAVTMGNHDYSFHDKALDTIVSELSRLVTAHVSHVKSKIVPKVEAFKASYADYLTRNSIKNPVEDFEIRAYETPSLLTNERFLRFVADRNGKQPIAFKDRFEFQKASSIDDIRSIFTLDNPKLDEDIAQWVSLVGHEWIINTFNEFLSSQSTGFYESIANYNDYVIVNHGILFVLVGNANKTSGEKFTWLREYGYDLIFRSLRKIEAIQRSKRIIIEALPVQKVICVDKKLYDSWLNAGGSPEIVLGILVSPTNERSYVLDNIIPKSKKYLDMWYQYCTYNRGSEAVARDRNIREYLKIRSFEMIEEIIADETNEEYKSSVYRKMAMDLCDKEIFSLKTSQLNSPFEVAVTLVAKCGYFKTCGYEFICDMQAAAEENKEIYEKGDSRAAATVAAIRYLSDYMVSQMSIVRVPV